MFNDKRYKVYIIGSIPRKITLETKIRYSKAEKELENFRIQVINPIRNLSDPKLSWEKAYKKNISELLECNAIYLLSEPDSVLKKCPELKISFSLNLIIMHQALPLYEEKQLEISI